MLGIYQSGYVVQDKVGPNIKKSDAQKAAELQDLTENGTVISKLAYGVGQGVEAFDETFPTIANIQDKSEDVTLPEEYVGVVMVFKTFNKVSYALVMKTQGPVHVLDVVRSL